MRAVQVQRVGPGSLDSGDAVTLKTAVPVPEAKAGSVLVRVSHASINPVDLRWIEGELPAPTAPPYTVGVDFAGEVVAGDDERVPIGSRVFGTTLGNGGTGSCAEYLSVPAQYVALAPRSVSPAVLAALPLAGLTALQALNRGCVCGRGCCRLVILGASGGVGHFAVQLARALGAVSIVTTSDKRFTGTATNIGATQVLDCEKGPPFWYDVLNGAGFDLVLDTIHEPDAPEHALKVLRPGGAYLSLRPLSEEAKTLSSNHVIDSLQVDTKSQLVGHASLDTLAELCAHDMLTACIDEVYPLEQTAEALRACRAGHVKGKAVVDLSWKRQTAET